MSHKPEVGDRVMTACDSTVGHESWALVPRGVSVVLCCHNSAARLPATLCHLKKQRVPQDVSWEVIIIDNASTDETAEIAMSQWSDDAPTSMRVVNECELGLSHARERGFAEARYDVVSFVDDDNWVCPEWVAVASEVMHDHPEIGACGGLIRPVCEVTPPSWFELFAEKYAIGSQGAESGDITDGRGVLWGAGLTVRKSAWLELQDLGFRPILPDRRGQLLSAGGDSELCFALRLIGWRLWYDERMLLEHFLPESRLTWSYLRKLHRGFGASYVWLDCYKTVLRWQSNRAESWIKQTRLWRALSVVKALIKAKVQLSLTKGKTTEGNPRVLRIESCIGQLLEFTRYKTAMRASKFLAMQSDRCRRNRVSQKGAPTIGVVRGV